MYKIHWNFACFASKIFLGNVPHIMELEMHYRIPPVSDYVAKFHGDRPRNLERTRGERKKYHR